MPSSQAVSRQRPVRHDVPASHAWKHPPQCISSDEKSNVSSVCPLQLSSFPLHVSAVGSWVRAHDSEPTTQVTVPAEHSPCSPVRHALPASGNVSSVRPSQLSSAPLQVSESLHSRSLKQRPPPANCGRHS